MKIQISLRIRTGWSESLLGALWKANNANFLHEVIKGSGQTALMRSLIWVFVGCICQKVRFGRCGWFLPTIILLLYICTTFQTLQNMFEQRLSDDVNNPKKENVLFGINLCLQLFRRHLARRFNACHFIRKDKFCSDWLYEYLTSIRNRLSFLYLCLLLTYTTRRSFKAPAISIVKTSFFFFFFFFLWGGAGWCGGEKRRIVWYEKIFMVFRCFKILFWNFL